MTYAQIAQQKHEVMGAIQGLVKELQTLAPHPDQPGYTGPVFLQNNPNFTASNDQDGMLGAMMMETMLGDAFAQAASDHGCDALNDMDITNAVEVYSEYISDVEGSTQYKAAHGQGTMAKLSGTSISAGFNLRSSITQDMQDFYDDLPKRMMIEKSLAFYARELAALDAPVHTPAQPLPQCA